MAFKHGTPNSIVTDGLVFCVDAANKDSYPGSGTTATDIISNTSTTLQSSGMFENVNAGVFSFDGGTNSIDCGDNNIVKPSGAMTIEYWFKGISASVNASGIGTLGNNGSRGYLLGPNNGSIIYFFLAPSATSLDFISYSITIDTNKWYCLTGVYNPSTYIRMYLDGIQVTNSNTSPSSLYTGNGISLKLGSRGSGVLFSGKISNFKLYHKVLQPSEVLQNYNALKNRFRT